MESDFEVLVKTRTTLNLVTDALEECAETLKGQIVLVAEETAPLGQAESYASGLTKKYFDLVEQARNV